jgi:exodeoxyribonuclease VII large subunit
MRREQELARVSKHFPSEILSVCELARSVRDLLEHRYPLLWVAGEISNLTMAKSGHVYFILKDQQAQVRCVMFRHRHQHLDWELREGVQVEAQALVTLYEPRGDFQLNVETMRRAGLGALFDAFLRLRDKLAKEGLFDAAKKRALPAFPRTIGVVTSLQAAALRDVLTTLRRRNPSIAVVVYPVPVQGEGSAGKIADMLRTAGERRECEALLLVRGGGSIEDLWAFNEESVARAIRACPVPVVTGIGHETDFTIADFAADRRAPTPTAAAEILSPERAPLLAFIGELAVRLGAHARRDLESRMQRADHLARRLVHPGTTLRIQAGVLDQLRRRIGQAANTILTERHWQIAGLAQRARLRLPNVRELSAISRRLLSRLQAAASLGLERPAAVCARLRSSLAHLDPAAVLDRGYSIVSRQNGDVVRDSSVLAVGETVGLRFARGRARARIDGKD